MNENPVLFCNCSSANKENTWWALDGNPSKTINAARIPKTPSTKGYKWIIQNKRVYNLPFDALDINGFVSYFVSFL